MQSHIPEDISKYPSQKDLIDLHRALERLDYAATLGEVIEKTPDAVKQSGDARFIALEGAFVKAMCDSIAQIVAFIEPFNARYYGEFGVMSESSESLFFSTTASNQNPSGSSSNSPTRPSPFRSVGCPKTTQTPSTQPCAEVTTPQPTKPEPSHKSSEIQKTDSNAGCSHDAFLPDGLDDCRVIVVFPSGVGVAGEDALLDYIKQNTAINNDHIVFVPTAQNHPLFVDVSVNGRGTRGRTTSISFG